MILELTSRQKKIFWALSFLFVLLSSLGFFFDNWGIFALPLFLLIAYLFLFRLDKIFELIIFFTPLSIQLSEFFPQLGLDLFLPTEPLIAAFMLLFLFKLLLGLKISKDFLQHPVTLVIYAYLAWLFFTSLTSTLPLVSIKYTLVKAWYIVVYYFYSYVWLSKYKHFTKFIWLYIIPLSFVIVYTLFRHSQYGFNNFEASHFVMSPFFRDHTIYGATIALFIPPVLAIAIGSKTWNLSKLISLFFLSLLMFALVYSYTRAAWLSLFGALGVYLLIKLKIKFKYLAISGIIILLLSFSFWSSIYFQLQNNQQDSSGDFSEHVESMANIATDASNLERINRWKAAIRLFAEKPVLGWGPGTYQFQYSQFQFSYDKTIISTNFGDGGNAHSEYLGALSETGLIGAIVYILIIIFTLKTGILAYYQCNDEKLKLILLGVLLGLLTYYLHSVLNNYLDTDKISIPFWTFTAMIVRLDVFSLENVKKEH